MRCRRASRSRIKDHRSNGIFQAGKFKTGIAGHVYTNAELGCRMTAPGEDWSIVDTKDPARRSSDSRSPSEARGTSSSISSLSRCPFRSSRRRSSPSAASITRRTSRVSKVIADETNPVKDLAGHRLEFRSISGTGKPRRGFEVILAEAWRWLSAGPGRGGAGLRKEAKASFDKMDAPIKSQQPRVLIVGAGPTGLTLACDLARRGIPLRLVDSAPEPFKGSRAKGLRPRTLEVFEDFGRTRRCPGVWRGLSPVSHPHRADLSAKRWPEPNRRTQSGGSIPKCLDAAAMAYVRAAS